MITNDEDLLRNRFCHMMKINISLKEAHRDQGNKPGPKNSTALRVSPAVTRLTVDRRTQVTRRADTCFLNEAQLVELAGMLAGPAGWVA